MQNPDLLSPGVLTVLFKSGFRTTTVAEPGLIFGSRLTKSGFRTTTVAEPGLKKVRYTDRFLAPERKSGFRNDNSGGTRTYFLHPAH